MQIFSLHITQNQVAIVSSKLVDDDDLELTNKLAITV